MSKSRTSQRKAQRQRERRQRQMMYGAVAIAVVAVVVLGLLILASQPVAVAIDEEIIARYEGLEVSQTSDGYPRIGDPAAPVEIREYSSFTCTHCGTFHDTTFMTLLENEIANGEVNFVFVAVPRIAQDEIANRAVYCAMQQDAFWPMHDLAFSWPSQFGNAAFTASRFNGAAAELGLDTGAFSGCLNAAETTAWLEQTSLVWQNLLNMNDAVTGTPTLAFNGVVSQSGALPITDIREQIAAALQ